MYLLGAEFPADGLTALPHDPEVSFRGDMLIKGRKENVQFG